MKITIKKFMELQNVSFTTPAKIEAGHDVGKSTIFRAALFAITGKDFDGKEFDGKIYPKKSETVADLQVEVQIEQSGIIFTKIAKGSEKRAKGSEETILQKSVTATYMVDFKVVGKSEYDDKISEIFGNFQLFCNPDYFRNLSKDDKRQIFTSLVKIDRNTYFAGIPDKALSKGKIAEQKKQISEKEANLAEYSKVQEPEKIEIVNFDEQIAELRLQRENATAKLTPDQLKENAKINAEISELETSVFVPEKLIPLLPEIEKPVYFGVEDLQNGLINTQILEPNTVLFDTQIENLKKKVVQIKSLSLQIENYEDNVKNAKCTLCQVCASKNCEFKKIELRPLSELQDEISQLMPLAVAEKSLQNAESQKIDYLRNFESEKAEKIDDLQRQIRDAENKNEALKLDYEKRNKEIAAKNTEISSRNEAILKDNLKNEAEYQNKKATQIQALKSKLHTLPIFDYSEIDSKIENLEILQKEQQAEIDIYNKNLGAYSHAKTRIAEISEELKLLKSALIASERDLIAFEAAEKRYYNDFEAKINAEMPENIKISLFRQNLSNDGFSEVFDIEFNGSIYAGNGKTIAFYIWLCGWFQSKFGKDLPIFIDEAIILNEKLYSDVKNALILMRNDNYSTLKITEL